MAFTVEFISEVTGDDGVRIVHVQASDGIHAGKKMTVNAEEFYAGMKQVDDKHWTITPEAEALREKYENWITAHYSIYRRALVIKLGGGSAEQQFHAVVSLGALASAFEKEFEGTMIKPSMMSMMAGFQQLDNMMNSHGIRDLLRNNPRFGGKKETPEEYRARHLRKQMEEKARQEEEAKVYSGGTIADKLQAKDNTARAKKEKKKPVNAYQEMREQLSNK